MIPEPCTSMYCEFLSAGTVSLKRSHEQAAELHVSLQTPGASTSMHGMHAAKEAPGALGKRATQAVSDGSTVIEEGHKDHACAAEQPEVCGPQTVPRLQPAAGAKNHTTQRGDWILCMHERANANSTAAVLTRPVLPAEAAEQCNTGTPNHMPMHTPSHTPVRTSIRTPSATPSSTPSRTPSHTVHGVKRSRGAVRGTRISCLVAEQDVKHRSADSPPPAPRCVPRTSQCIDTPSRTGSKEPASNSAGTRGTTGNASDPSHRPATPPPVESSVHEWHASLPLPKSQGVQSVWNKVKVEPVGVSGDAHACGADLAPAQRDAHPVAQCNAHPCGAAATSPSPDSDAATVSISAREAEGCAGGQVSCADSARLNKLSKNVNEEAVQANVWLVKHLKTAPVRVKRCVLDALWACHCGETMQTVAAHLPQEWNGSVRYGVMTMIQKTAGR